MLTTDKFNLSILLEKIERGEIQLPDFQRDWIWKDEQIKSLLESVIRDFPINSILLLECDSDNLKFATRPIAGVDKVDSKPQYLILDGQQRLTSLYCALFADKPVEIPPNKKLFYYIDMKKAIEIVKNPSSVEDDKDMIISVDEKRKLKTKDKTLDLSTPEKEFNEGMFPLNKLRNSFSWLSEYQSSTHNIDIANEFHTEIIQKVLSYQVVYIKLDKNTPLEAVCKIFEKVNISGVVLKVFDLATALLASHVENGKRINLRKDWEEIKKSFNDTSLDILQDIEGTDFITALTLLASYENFRMDRKKAVACKRENILKLNPGDYLRYKKIILEGFIEAGKFLEEEGIASKKYLPYKPQLIPMAAIFAELDLRGKNNAASREKIRRWYWCSVFGESYRDGQGARFAKDIVQVIDWINYDELPEIIKNTQLVAAYLISLKKIQSAAFKGLVSVIFRNKATDFRSGRVMVLSANHDESIDLHHIFPKKYCEDKNFSKDIYDSILNKTPISGETNKIIGKKAPSVYIRDFEKAGNKPQQLNASLRSHFIDAALCRADNFDAFIIDRAKKILDAIEELTGRKVSGRDSSDIKKFFGSAL